jgi:hypothetical protein
MSTVSQSLLSHGLLALLAAGVRWHRSVRTISPMEPSREKAGGRYTAGFFLRLPARFPVPSRLRSDCNGMRFRCRFAIRRSH